jgi:capsular polysaccharide biosynthesis protein
VTTTADDRPGLLGLPLRLPQLVLAVVVGLVAAGIGGLVTVAGPDVYQSRATVLIDQPVAISAAPFEGTLQKLDRLRFKYAPLLTTKVMRDPIVAAAGVPRDHIVSLVASPRQSSLLVDVFAKADSPAEARRHADARAAELSNKVQAEQEKIGVAEPQRFTFAAVDPARPGVRVTSGYGRALTVAVVAGLFGSLATALVLYSLRIGRTD